MTTILDPYYTLLSQYYNNYDLFISKCKDSGLTVLTIVEFKDKINTLFPKTSNVHRTPVTRSPRSCCGGGASR
jgi:hypothetical protein